MVGWVKKGWLCLLALVLLGAAWPARAAAFHTDVRVLLSTPKESALNFTPVGEYTLREDPSLKVDNGELTVTAVGGRVSLTVDGKTLTGASFTLLSGDYEGTTAYIRLKNAKYGTCTYLGNMTFDAAAGCVRAVNTLPLEQYVWGVVPHEMSNSFPLEALKAQAVCARGYAVANCAKDASRPYDLRDTSEDQVYHGYASAYTRAIAAVNGTAGQVLTYENDIIEAYYSASNGGQTERTGNVWKTDLPYYVNADDPYDIENPSSAEERAFIPAEFNDVTRKLVERELLSALQKGADAAAGEKVTLLRTVAVLPNTPQYEAPSRCFTRTDVVLMVQKTDGSEGQLTVTLDLETLDYGDDDETLGLFNTRRLRLRMHGAESGVCYRDGVAYPGWYLTSRRYGHGIGLSQRGAQQRAYRLQGYEDILRFYYADTALHTVMPYEDAPELESESYLVRAWGVSNIAPGTSPEKLLGRIDPEKGELSLITASGKAKKDGAVCTGNFLRTTYKDGTHFSDLPLVVYGDINGDGKIDAGDANALRAHLLNAPRLTGPYLCAGDIDHDGEVTASDLLALLRSLHEDAEIEQKGGKAV